ncbi:cytochrome P450 [Deinococcus wulumuqiensis]|uniref:Cytochrome P450 n=1 Tax=Deinococcus wulumuqiensis TaxID=980427 RepID=A0AAV4K7P2_9DEIO|nr:cytochrome P450 [Deinococcus wulumuqiensis]QII21446.1 cytochrome P450 [Deinococcus wulumuqiensis R12]GGI90883.1 cytochrome P450 [Deinococcus wulumuqiensis]GGP30867.1 cytochrome P450 [Deinococcus wulumuqiensis]
MTASFKTLPEPHTRPGSGHLQDWALGPLPLIEQGAQRARLGGGDLFRLRLGGPAVVGFSPAWNRRVLTDLTTFVSRGSFSAVVPYLAGGVILTDAPEHAARRQRLNPGFGRVSVERLRERMRQARTPVPRQPFDALPWADETVRRQLNAAYFSGDFDDTLLAAFLAPLRRPFPVPALPRPLLFRRVEQEIRRLAERRLVEGGDDLLSSLAPLPGGLTETRISLAAAHDTTTHALAYALWALANRPEFQAADTHPAVLKEVLRLYPPGWMGSRRLSRAVEWRGTELPRGTLALYSPYLTGRDPALWARPLDFRPERWEKPPPAWAYLPFGGGERTCLGLHLAQTLILDVLAETPPLRARWGNDEPHPGVTLGPRGPLVVERR